MWVRIPPGALKMCYNRHMPYKNKEQQKEYQRKWVQNRRQNWLNENGPCIDCGSDEELEVDHVDQTEKISHRVWSWSKERLAEELAKCVVRCHSCHQKRTRVQNSLALRGEGNPRSKLTVEEVKYIKGSSLSSRELASDFKMHLRSIEKIRSGERWKHIE